MFRPMALLENLLTLHRVDSQVRALTRRVDTARRYFEDQERQVAVLERKKADLETQVRQLQASVHAIELEQTTATERVDKLRSELNTATNDKQYRAILNEMKVLENQKDEIVQRGLEELQRIEDAKSRLSVNNATLEERLKVRDLAKAKLDECTGDVGERLSELESERARAADLLPEATRKAFDRAADLTEGEPMAEVTIVSMRHREFACGECNLELPFETYARLASAAEELVQCKSCSRILYLAEQNRPAGEKGVKSTRTQEEQDRMDKAKFEKTRKL
jgi:predicted  nucleic acid-binding Zn-ribbon protein